VKDGIERRRRKKIVKLKKKEEGKDKAGTKSKKTWTEKETSSRK